MKLLRVAILITLVTTLIFGVIYPLVVTGLGQLFFPAQANGSLFPLNGIFTQGHRQRARAMMRSQQAVAQPILVRRISN